MDLATSALTAGIRRGFVIALLVAAALWAVCAAFGVGGQRKLFYEEGQEEMYDFWMPRMCLEQGYAPARSADYGIDPGQGGVRGPEKPVGEIIEFSDWYPVTLNLRPASPRPGYRFVTGDMDKVYPALALLPYRFFPATRAGSWWFSSLGGLVFLLALIPLLRSVRPPSSRAWLLASLLLVPVSAPFLFALERGNPIWLSAAAVAVFLAWWDDECAWRRYVAAICLAVAAVMKIAPAALGLLYLLGRRPTSGSHSPAYCREIALSVVAAAILFLVPWVFVKEGFAAIPIMFGNAAHHADFVLRTSDFGFVQVWRTVRLLFGLDVHSPWPGMYLVARMSQLCGLVALVVGARRRDYLLLVGGMLLAAGNMYYYAALYLIPVFLLTFLPSLSRPAISPGLLPPATCSAFSTCFVLSLFFVILCPLQFVFRGHSGNAVLCNLALMTMMFFRLTGRWR